MPSGRRAVFRPRRFPISRPVRTNERIRVREVRLIDDEGNQLGIVPTRQALEIARERGLDLVEVAPNAMPPVCRLMDYGKYRYEESRKLRESRKNQKTTDLKEVRLKPKIDDHDLATKSRQALKFLEDGDKVKLTVVFRGREVAHAEIGRGLLLQVAEQVGSVGVVEQTPKLEGRSMTMMLSPKKAPGGGQAPPAAAAARPPAEAPVQ
jgi:translation initiation factor IF-3